MKSRSTRPRLIQAMVDAFSLPDLRGKLLFTLAILIIFRFVAQITVPGVDAEAVKAVFDKSGLLSMLDMFSGGAMKTFSIVALGVYPYITASIIMQLLVPVIPRLQHLAKEGESGREKINLYTHWLTVPLAALQGYSQIFMMRKAGVDVPGGPLNAATITLSLTAGTLLLVWLGERITERGIGNGISLIIFSGIIVTVPQHVWQSYNSSTGDNKWVGPLVLLIFTIAVMTFIVYFTEAFRRIPVQYSRSAFRGRRMYRQSGTSHIPLRVNQSGMIPLIFAYALLELPGTICTQFFSNNSTAKSVAHWLSPAGGPWDSSVFWVAMFLMVVAFAFFYTMVTWEQQNLAQNLQRQGGFIPGIRPGKQTAEYLDRVVYRITWGGALFLGIVAFAPFITQYIAPDASPNSMILGSAGALIVVGVALDTMRQIEAQLLMRRYEGFLK
jgi:preprotein translocase subunit SecY